MPDVATPRRQRRAISSTPTAAAAPEANQGSIAGPQDALLGMLEYLRNAERMRQYRMIGRLSRVQILRPEGATTIDFRKDGPVLAFAAGTEQLVVTDEWRGIPPKWDDTEEFCKACLSDCDVCGATGKKLCEAFKCGGAGCVPIPAVACPGAECLNGGLSNKIKPGCDLCRGTGSYVGTKECPVCAGSGQAKCSVCRGTCKRPTGIQNGSTNYREPTCVDCSGSKFAHREIPQELAQFVNARIGAMVALGPIVRFAVESVGGEGTPPIVYDVSADSNGQYLVILLENEQPGAHVYMIGGILKARTR